MCINPLQLKNPRSARLLQAYDAQYVIVPCGQCEECRDAEQTQWRQRIMAEINYTYNVCTGYCVFLTFTYRPEDLPTYSIIGAPEEFASSFPCFNHEHVIDFMNRVGMYLCDVVGKGNYKYFLAAEYGSTTKRPHYHLLLHINTSIVNVKEHSSAVAETLRNLWKYGFMFPKFDRKNSPTFYIDDDGTPRDILLGDLTGSGKYVSKYVTKDLSWYELPALRWLSSLHGAEKSRIVHLQSPTFTRQDKYLAKVARKNGIDEYTIEQNALDTACNRTLTNIKPKHWQSKGYGSSHECMKYWIKDNPNDIIDGVFGYINHGVVNPLTQEVEPMCDYFRNKYLYVYRESPIKDKYGRPCHERYLTNFGVAIFRSSLEQKVLKLSNKIQHYTGAEPKVSYQTAVYNYLYKGLKESQLEHFMLNANLSSDEMFLINDETSRFYLVRSDRMTATQDKIFRPEIYQYNVVRHYTASAIRLKLNDGYSYVINKTALAQPIEVKKYLLAADLYNHPNAVADTPEVIKFFTILYNDILPLMDEYVFKRIAERKEHYRKYNEYGKVIKMIKARKHSKIIAYE
jgi:hypothetical protein